MSVDWEEVKKLAFDFQRTQHMSSVQKLSERNCIDIVKRLIEMKAIDVIFTNDGKEYITSDHLTREIENELYAAGGRIDIAELATILNVNYDQIEAKANYLSRNSSGEINIVLGQLISKEYKDNLAADIDLSLQESGTVAISELAKLNNLPADLLMSLIGERLNVFIKGKLDKDSRTLYTYDYLARHESKIVGILSAITRPVSLQTLINRHNFTEKMLMATLNEQLSKKRILGTISGSMFIPDIYSKTQAEYVTNFYKHNRYLEYATLIKMGISSPQAFLEKKFGDELVFLETCAVDRMFKDQIESSVEECIQNSIFVDLIETIPSVLNSNDIEKLIQLTLEGNAALSSSTIILCNTIVVSKVFVDKIKDSFGDLRKKRVEEDLKSGALLRYFSKNKEKKDELSAVEEKRGKSSGGGDRDKKGGKKTTGGGGGNTQGREIKTKAVKKKYKAGKQGKDKDVDDVDEALEFLPNEKIITFLKDTLGPEIELDDMPEDLLEELAYYIREDLQRLYETFAREAFISHANEANKNKKSFADIQKMVNDVATSVQLYAKGIQFVESDDAKSKLTKHLQRTLCTDLVNQMLMFQVDDADIVNLNTDTRAKLINKLDSDIKEDFARLNDSLGTDSVDDFLLELEKCATKLEMMIKKVDKKLERNTLSEHRQNLLMQLNECNDPILGLHISILFAFQTINDAILHASGKFVPIILPYLEKELDPALYDQLKQSHDLILQFVSSKVEADKAELTSKMNQLYNDYKLKVIEFKKKPSK